MATTHPDGRPKLAVELASEQSAAGDRTAFDRFMRACGRPPHCDQRVLHRLEDCEYCGSPEAWPQQKERAALGVRNTGVEGDQPGRVHPCPAELARSQESLQSWAGNRPAPPPQHGPLAVEDHVAEALLNDSLWCPVCGGALDPLIEPVLLCSC